MAKLLTQSAAAKRLGISAKTFRTICASGRGPRVFNPLDGLPLYADSVLDEWVHERDDRPIGRAS